MNFKASVISSIFLALAVICVQTAHASESSEDKFYLEALIGDVRPVGSSSFANDSAGLGLGVEGIYKLLPEIGVGAYMNYAYTNPANYLQYGAEGKWFHSSGLNAGIKVGATQWTNPVVSVTNFSFGPTVGYDFRVPALPVSVGADATWMFVRTANAYSLPGLFACLKLWF